MTRPQNWSPLAGSDPIPGDPDRVRDLARKLQSTSRAVKAQSNRLKNLETGWWKGRAAERFEDKQKKLPPLLDDVSQRYDLVASALDSYYPDLENAQETSLDALTRAKAAEAAIEVAQQGIIAMQQHAFAQNALVSTHNAQNPTGPPAQPAPWTGPDWHAALQVAQEDMDAARALLDSAVTVRDEAAGRTAGDIASAIDDGLKNEGGFLGFVKRGAKFLVDALPLEELSTILSVVAAVLVVISLFIPGLNLVTAGLIIAGLGLAVDSILLAAGEKSVGEWALSAVGFAFAGVGAVAGRLAGKMLPAIIRTTTTTTTVSRSTSVVVASRAGHTVIGIRQTTLTTRVIETVTAATRLPAAALFPSLNTLKKAKDVADLIDMKGILDIPDFPAAVIEFTDEILFEVPRFITPAPISSLPNLRGGLHHTPAEEAHERAADVDAIPVGD